MSTQSLVVKIQDGREDKEISRRRYYVAAAAVRMFASGAEYMIIVPSVWFYLKQFNAKHSFLGIVQASFQVTSIISALLVGRIYDKIRRTKLLALLCNFAELIGNIVYSLGYSKYVVLLGRLICGLGEGFVPVVYAEVGSVVTSKERIRAITYLEGARILGATLGPVLNLAFKNIDVSIGSWHITYGSAAGLVMAILWVLVQVLTSLFIYDMYREMKLSKDDSLVSLQHEKEEGVPEEDLDSSTLKDSIKELLKLDILAVMMADFLFWFAQGSLGTLAPLILVEDLHLGKGYVTLYFIGFALLLLGSMIVMSYVPQINSVTCVIICCIVQSLVQGSRIVYQYERPNKQAMLVIIIISTVVYAIITAPSFIYGRTLLTKLVSVKSQGLLQGVYTVMVSVALSIGGLLGSIVLNHLDIWGYVALVAYISTAALLKYCKGGIDEKVEELEAREASKEKGVDD